MSVRSSQDLAKSVLLRLCDQLDEPQPDLTIQDMLSGFSPAPTEVGLRTAVSLLCQAQLISSRNVGGHSRYQLTAKGKASVAKHFTVDDSGAERTYQENANGFDLYASLQHPAVDWTQLGAVLTGIGIIVAIILWWLS